MIEKGFYKMDSDTYHAAEGISRSGLVRMLRSPAHYKTPVIPTPIMEFGKNLHTFVLEPDTAKFILYPDDCLVGSGKGQRERKAVFDLNAQERGQTILKPDDMDKMKHMRDAVHSHPEASELLKDGEPEISGFWQDPIHPEITCRIRMDWINKEKMVIVDLKKTRDARLHSFRGDAYRLGYDMEASFYLYGATHITGVEHHDFYFIACEDEPPWGVMVYKASGEMIMEGLKRCARALGLYKECLDKDNWPCYPEDVQELGLPGWVLRKEVNHIIE